jgi:hypothetical protein
MFVPAPRIGYWTKVQQLSCAVDQGPLPRSNDTAYIQGEMERSGESTRVLTGDESGWRPRTGPPIGSIGYTGSYREPSADIVEVSVVSVLEARGPD